jgi:hypothetical protein
MSRSKFENGLSYYEITRRIEEYIDLHWDLESKQEKMDNLRELLLYTMEYPEYMNYYDAMRESIEENIRDNYLPLGCDPEFQTVCSDWLALFGGGGEGDDGSASE